MTCDICGEELGLDPMLWNVMASAFAYVSEGATPMEADVTYKRVYTCRKSKCVEAMATKIGGD